MCRSIVIIAALLLLVAPIEAAEQNTSDARWSFAVEGLPEIEGKVITRMGFGNNINYQMGSSDATIQVSMRGSPERTSMMFKFNDAGINCVKNQETVLEFGEDRAMVSGKVGCRSVDASPGDRTWDIVGIEGWFDLKD